MRNGGFFFSEVGEYFTHLMFRSQHATEPMASLAHAKVSALVNFEIDDDKYLAQAAMFVSSASTYLTYA